MNVLQTVTSLDSPVDLAHHRDLQPAKNLVQKVANVLIVQFLGSNDLMEIGTQQFRHDVPGRG